MTSEPLRTEDGSHTLRHPGLGEPYHALQGARSEAESKFILPSRLRERLNEGPVRLLDVGFGLGVNCAAALECAGPHPLEIHTVESEPEALERARALYPDDPIRTALQRDGRHQTDTASVRLFLGDLRRVLDQLDGPYDLVFHDPFSPLKNTECWTMDLFRALRDRMADDGLLLTYSEARAVRSGFHLAGFHVGATPARPPHRGGTIASPSPFPDAFPPDAPEVTAEPYRDPDLDLDGREIRSRREARVRARAG